MGTLRPQSNGPLYNTVIGILAVDGWVVTFGTSRSTTNFILFDVAP